MTLAIREILDGVQALKATQGAFDPKTSDRSFSFLAADAAVAVMLPTIAKALQKQAPNVHLRAVQPEAENLLPWLQSGRVDLAIGSFPSLAQGIRRQRLFTAPYSSLVRRSHPRLNATPKLAEFIAERHVLVTAAGSGHGIQAAENVLEAAIAAENITLRIPGFLAAALAAKHTDAVVTLPTPLAALLARELDLRLIEPPVKLPRFEIAQYWHERFHREPGHQWMRSVLASLFGAAPK
jgi:DNA-binding transcriptional LysR family regulator